ncbi:MAG: cupredoxin domain-containing protein [Pseudonocardiaceae bacterium]
MTTPPTAAIRFRPIAVLLTMLVAVLGLVLGCGGGAGSPAVGSGGPTAGNAPNTIVIKNFTFTPATLTVAPGTEITVINQDQAPHTMTANDKSIDSGTLSGGQHVEVTAPTNPGKYPYICTIHQYMTGTLIVK